MEKDEIRRIANEKGMRNEDLFVEFISRRFPNETMENYVGEWAGRFLSGDPTPYMDGDSKRIYLELIKNRTLVDGE